MLLFLVFVDLGLKDGHFSASIVGAIAIDSATLNIHGSFYIIESPMSIEGSRAKLRMDIGRGPYLCQRYVVVPIKVPIQFRVHSACLLT